MKIEQKFYSPSKGWKILSNSLNANDIDLVMIFGSTGLIKDATLINEISSKYATAEIIGCSTSGEIIGNHVNDDTLTVTAIKFEKTQIKSMTAVVKHSDDSFEVGKLIAEKLSAPNLKHLFLLSDGLQVNGSELASGLKQHLPKNVSVTGGLAGDGARFGETFVINKNEINKNTVTAIGFYGDNIHFGFGSFGGWETFGIERMVTKSHKNVLFELDGQPALALYKSFLGEKAKDLPASGLLFPLSIQIEKDQEPLVRTILAINETDQSITFAGDIPEGAKAKLMKATIDGLIEGAEKAAETSMIGLNGKSAELAILISCVGRKLVMKQLVEEEVEGVAKQLSTNTAITGFYSYGELSPFSNSGYCELHNQTMTITTITEA